MSAKPRRAGARAALLGAFLLYACGSQRSIAEDEVVAALIEATCGEAAPCCDKGGYERVAADCEEVIAQSWRDNAAAARDAGAKYDATAAAACIEEIRRRVQECQSFKSDDGKSEACADVYRDGQTPLHGACTSDWECRPSSPGVARCGAFVTQSGIEHRCTAVILVGEGESVRTSETAEIRRGCEAGLFADENLTCRGRFELGEACASPVVLDDCEAGLTCDTSNTGKCVTALPVGAECTEGPQCEGHACRMGRCVVPSIVARCE